MKKSGGKANLTLTTEFNSGASTIDFNRARIGPTTMGSAATFGMINGKGYNGTTYVPGSRIELAADGAPGSSSVPGRIIFKTSSSGTSGLNTKMTIESDGNVGINQSNPIYKLHVSDTTVASGMNTIAGFEGSAEFNALSINANTASAQGGGVLLHRYNGSTVATMGGLLNASGDTSAFISPGAPGASGPNAKPSADFSIGSTFKSFSIRVDDSSGIDLYQDLGINSSLLKVNADEMYIRGKKTTSPANPTQVWVTGKLSSDTLSSFDLIQYQNGAAAGYLLQSDAVGNARWVAPDSAVASGWSLTGNSGTTPGTNFWVQPMLRI